MQHNYLVYSTPWSEGEVVASVHDSEFAIGCDQTTGETIYWSLEKLLKIEGLELRTESDIVTAARSDGAWYTRKPTDRTEYNRYVAIRELTRTILH